MTPDDNLPRTGIDDTTPSADELAYLADIHLRQAQEAAEQARLREADAEAAAQRAAEHALIARMDRELKEANVARAQLMKEAAEAYGELSGW